MNSIKVLIPAAGLGSRLGINFPKTLLKIGSKTILESIISKLNSYDEKPTIIINKKYKHQFIDISKKKKLNLDLILQNKPKGMGDAVLQMKKIKNYNQIKDVILIWGDIPFIRKSTMNKTINEHFKNNNDFTFPTIITQDPYTIVNRNKYNDVTSVFETREKKSKKKILYGEREIGFFIFKKKPVIKILNANLSEKINQVTKEHSFLYVIKHLKLMNLKVVGLNIGSLKDTISINTKEDLKKFIT